MSNLDRVSKHDANIPKGKVNYYTREVSTGHGVGDGYVVGFDKNGKKVRESLKTFDHSKLESYYGGF